MECTSGPFVGLGLIYTGHLLLLLAVHAALLVRAQGGVLIALPGLKIVQGVEEGGPHVPRAPLHLFVR